MDINRPIGQQLNSGYNFQAAADTAKDSLNSASNSFSGVRDSINESVKDFGSKDASTLGNEFLDSNSLIAKFVFLLLVLIVFMILFNLGIYIISYFVTPSKDPYVIKGLINGYESKVITQDPKLGNSVTIYRSNNESKGIEFTWSVWLKRVNVDAHEDTNSTYHRQNQHVFSKGLTTNKINSDSSETNVFTYEAGGNGPAVYFLTDNNNNTGKFENNEIAQNKLQIVMDTVDPNSPTENIIIDDIPTKKWFHLAIRVQNKIMDIYINGTVVKRVTFESLPKQNYGDVYVCKDGGFSGQLSDLRYFDSALNVFQLKNIVYNGPNLRSADADKNRNYDYLSNTWYVDTN